MTESAGGTSGIPADWNRYGETTLPGFVGVDVQRVGSGEASGELQLRVHHLAPNGYLHAAAIVALADTLCGYGCRATLPDSTWNFTTVEMKCNFLRTTVEGSVRVNARMVHGGGTTQVWDASAVRSSDDKPLAEFRCTQMILRHGRVCSLRTAD